MIESIRFEHYKAFRSGKIKLKPITILLGANSVGKSSILQLLLMLQQTSTSSNYKSALRLHGENISMGEIKNLFRNKDTSENIVLEFEYKNHDLFTFLNVILKEEIIMSLIRPLSFYYRHMSTDSFAKKSKEHGVDLSILFNRGNKKVNEEIWENKEFFLNLCTTVSLLKNELEMKMSQKKGDLFADEIRFIRREKRSENISLAEYEKIYDFFKRIQKEIKEDVFSVEFILQHIIAKNEEGLKVVGLRLKQSLTHILNIDLCINKSYTAYSDVKVSSNLSEGMLIERKDLENFITKINYNSTLFSCISNEVFTQRNLFGDYNDDFSTISNIILKILDIAIRPIERSFSKEYVNYVSPLRAHPKRYYFLDKANINTTLDTLDGDSLTEILKENRVIRDRVNKWLKKFNLSVDVSTLQDVIHKLKVHQNDLDLDITDVGFGISQVLPVIVQGFLSFNDSLTIIEQPEIHLHPKMQADLADLFIDIVKSEKGIAKHLLIETHSEYLLKRLRRRMADPNSGLTPNEVGIYFIHPKSDKSDSNYIEELNITSKGAFDWPIDFYGGELLKDTIEFMKFQAL